MNTKGVFGLDIRIVLLLLAIIIFIYLIQTGIINLN